MSEFTHRTATTVEELEGCPFCARIAKCDVEQSYAGDAVVRFEPLNPVTPGHMLFIPGDHATHPDHEAMRSTIAYAERYAGQRGEDYNLITSHGLASSATVEHIHIHYVPRRAGDGLALPWTGQHAILTPTAEVKAEDVAGVIQMSRWRGLDDLQAANAVLTHLRENGGAS